MPTEIEKRALEIQEACNSFFTICAQMEDLIEKGKTLDAKLSEASEKVGQSLKDILAKAEGIEEAERLEFNEFERGNIDRDSYEKRLRELTTEMSDVYFPFRARVRLDLNTFQRQLGALLEQMGVPSNLPTVDSEVKIKATEVEKKKITEIHEMVEQAKERLKGTAPEQPTGDLDSYRRFGVFYAQGKDWKKAEDCFSKAVKLNAQDQLAWRGLGYVNFVQTNYAQAIVSYKTALNISPNDGFLWYNLGTTYCVTRNFNEALTCYRRALEFLPNFAPAWCNLGNTYDNMGNYNEAVKSYLKAVELKPDFGAAWFNLASVYHTLGSHKNEKMCSEKAESLGYGGHS